MLKEQINIIFLYTDEEYPVLRNFMHEYILCNKELSVEEGFLIDVFSCNFQYFCRCLLSVNNPDGKIIEEDAFFVKKYIDFIQKYSDLLPFIYQKYDEFISKADYIKLYETAMQRGGILTPYYIKTNAERENLLKKCENNYNNIINKLNKFKICQQN
jgi:hypothetical protein